MIRFSSFAVLLPGLLSLGCRFEKPDLLPGRFPTVQASGTVTWDGKPVEGATVMFYCEKLHLTSYGKTDSTGHFQLSTYEPGDGSPEGIFKVSVKKLEQKIIQPSDNPAMPPISESINHLPQKYADFKSSGLQATIIADQSNIFQFALNEAS